MVQHEKESILLYSQVWSRDGQLMTQRLVAGKDSLFSPVVGDPISKH